MTAELAKRYHFAASHRLYSDELSEEENYETFGKCANPFGHGHNYALEVRVEGQPDPATGFVADRNRLDAFIENEVITRIDRADLNQDIPDFADTVPTTENLALAIGRWLRTGWDAAFPAGPRLASIRIEETPRNSFELTW